MKEKRRGLQATEIEIQTPREINQSINIGIYNTVFVIHIA